MIRLKFERIQKNLSQQDVGWLARVPQPVVSLIESGTWNPSTEHLERLAALFHISPPELLLQEVVIRESRPTVDGGRADGGPTVTPLCLDVKAAG